MGVDILVFFLYQLIHQSLFQTVAGCDKPTLRVLEFRNILFLQKIVLNPHMNEMGFHGPKHDIFGGQFYSKTAEKLRFHVQLHFHDRKYMIHK